MLRPSSLPRCRATTTRASIAPWRSWRRRLRPARHAVKLQTYTADTMTIRADSGSFHIGDPASLWAGKSLYQLYEEAHTPWEWHPRIFERCRSSG